MAHLGRGPWCRRAHGRRMDGISVRICGIHCVCFRRGGWHHVSIFTVDYHLPCTPSSSWQSLRVCSRYTLLHLRLLSPARNPVCFLLLFPPPAMVSSRLPLPLPNQSERSCITYVFPTLSSLWGLIKL